MERRRRRAEVRAELGARFAEYARTRERRVRNEIVEAHYGLAVQVAQQYARRGEPLDDLIQVALYGILTAVERYDPSRGVEFATFATHTARGVIKHHFRDHTSLVHVTRGPRDLMARVEAASAELHQSLGRAPRPRDVARHLRVDEDAVLEAIDARRALRHESIDAALEANEVVVPTDGAYDSVETRLVLERAMAKLSERDRLVVELRFRRGLTQREIGRVIGVSQMQVSCVLSRVIDDLRVELGGHALAG